MASSDTMILLDMTEKRKQYCSMHESSTELMYKRKQLDHVSTTPPAIHVSKLHLTIIISVATAVATACSAISMPIFLTDLVNVGSDPFAANVLTRSICLLLYILLILIRWCRKRELPCLRSNTIYMAAALIGFLSALKGLLSVFGSLPDRTRPELLGILSAAVLPNTVICRYIVLRKAVKAKQLLCATIVLLGVFVSLIPDIFGLGSTDETYIHDMTGDRGIHTDPQTTINGTNYTSPHLGSTVVYGWIWPLALAGRTLPLALAYVIAEREIKSPEVSFISFVFWTEFFNNVSIAALFWTDLIPHFGMSCGFAEFLTSLQQGIYCSFSTDPSCNGCLIPAIVYILASLGVAAFPLLLTKYAEGATYTVILISSARLVSVLFWTQFVDTDHDGLLWRPRFNIYTILTAAGLCIVIPTTCIYACISNGNESDSNGILKESKNT